MALNWFNGLVSPLTRILVQTWIGRDAAIFTDSWLKELAPKQQGDAEWQFQSLARKVLQEVADDLAERDKIAPDLKVAEASLVALFSDRTLPALFVEKNLDAAKIVGALRAKIPSQEIEGDRLFLELAVPTIVEKLCVLAPTLPEFHREHMKESIRFLQEAAEAVSELGTLLPNAKREELRFRRISVLTYDKMELIGVRGLRASARNYPLQFAYIDLQTEHSRPGMPSVVASETLLGRLSKQSPRLLITGEAGSGKSTLLKWIALEAARLSAYDREFELRIQSYESDRQQYGWGKDPQKFAEIDFEPIPTDHWSRRIPFLFRLRDCAINSEYRPGQVPHPSEFLRLYDKTNPLPNEEWVEQQLEAGALVLIDGIDEIPPDAREEELLSSLESLNEKYPNCYFIVTSRPAAISEDFLRDGTSKFSYERAALRDVGREDARRLIRNWHEAVARQATLFKENPDEIRAKADEVTEKVFGQPRLRQLTGNPLLCAMLCAVHLDNGELPKDQFDLCKQFIEMMLMLREKNRWKEELGARFPPEYSTVEYDERLRILSDIALTMVTGRKTDGRLDHETAVGLVKAYQAEHAKLNALDAEQILSMLLERCGILRAIYHNGPVEFLHNTLKEFLAGKRLAEDKNVEDSISFLVGNIGESDVLNTLLFAVRHPDHREYAEPLVQSLLKVETDDVSLSRTILIAMLLCRSVEAQLSSASIAQIDKLEEQLVAFPLESQLEAKTVAAGGDFLVDKLKREQYEKMTHSQIRWNVHALSLIDTNMAVEIAKGYIDTEDEDIINDLSGLFSALEIPFVLNRVQNLNSPTPLYYKKIVDLDKISGFSNINELYLSNTSVKNLNPLSELINLQFLHLENTAISTIDNLNRLQNIKELYLNNTFVTKLDVLEGLTQLRELYLDNTPVIKLDALTGLIELRGLYLDNTFVDDLTPLQGLNKLQRLSLNSTMVLDLKPLQQLSNLQRLSLDYTSIQDLQPIEKLKNLQRLYLSNTRVENIGSIQHLENLQRLSLDNTIVSDLKPLFSLMNLRELFLDNTPVSKADILRLRKELPHLKVGWSRKEN